MKNLFKILVLIFISISNNTFAQIPGNSSSMESGYWNFQMDQYEADSYSLNKTEIILIRKSDSIWVKLDSIWKSLKSMYKPFHNFKTIGTASSNERYYVYVTDSTFEVTDLNIINTADKVCLIRISLTKNGSYLVEEDYNSNCGLYYMVGDRDEIICKLMTLLKKVTSPG